ncbi:hypothetical protein BS50DRAFT_572381 [Corynespora cassiicola Philippines]|uniref:Uncharacterized protein n=1 Tax=Corynespora cassiicola Philippines TaxID=1448308 RepID=A0A2T2NUV2_CORCC|nr:hypothetical protein BS50DRAFT_572381 [Corynespora cassiicola Philippines]
MTPPKRALFSLNIDSNAEHIYQRVDDHNNDKHKVLETSGPVHGSTNLQLVTRPFEKAVERSIERIVDGKHVADAEGDITYETHQSVNGESPRRSTKTVHVKKKGKQSVEEQYDTSDL